jgi:SPP1 gp7 family putative phage head morphogenesis protein
MTMALTEAASVVLMEAARTRHLRALASLERRYAVAIRRAFRAQARAFIPAWQRAKSAQLAHLSEDEGDTWLPYFNDAVDATETLFKTATEEATERALAAGARNAALDIGVELSFDVATDPRAIQYIERSKLTLVENLTETTRERVRAVLADGVAKGRSPQQVAADLRKLYAGWSTPDPRRHIRDRAELIAITEMGEAYSYASLEQGRDMANLGLPMQKAWETVGDDRVDLPHCRANQQQGWIPLADQFQSGHDRPLAHPGCRCVLLVEMIMEGV